MSLLSGEPLALDLVNTRAATPDGDVDALDSVGGLRSWLHAQSGRLEPDTALMTESAAAAIRTFRGHVESAIDAVRRGAPPPADAVAAINRAAQVSPAYLAMTFTRNVPVACAHRSGDELAQLLAQLAEPTIELLTSGRAQDIRTCDGPNCRMIFLPTHPHRRWCCPETCGNRVRVARYYQRHKQ